MCSSNSKLCSLPPILVSKRQLRGSTRPHSDGRTFAVKLPDVCTLKRDPGPCPGSALRWYYDAERGTCRQFVYGGCKGNANKFRTLAACQQRCPSQGIDNSSRKRSHCFMVARNMPWDESRCAITIHALAFTQFSFHI